MHGLRGWRDQSLSRAIRVIRAIRGGIPDVGLRHVEVDVVTFVNYGSFRTMSISLLVLIQYVSTDVMPIANVGFVDPVSLPKKWEGCVLLVPAT